MRGWDGLSQRLGGGVDRGVRADTSVLEAVQVLASYRVVAFMLFWVPGPVQITSCRGADVSTSQIASSVDDKCMWRGDVTTSVIGRRLQVVAAAYSTLAAKSLSHGGHGFYLLHSTFSRVRPPSFDSFEAGLCQRMEPAWLCGRPADQIPAFGPSSLGICSGRPLL